VSKHYLIFIHGIGDNKGVEESYNKLIENIKNNYGKNTFDHKFTAIKINWHDPKESQLSKAQSDIFETAFPEFAHKSLSARKFFTNFLGDVVAYVSEDVNVVRRTVWKQIWERLEQPIIEEDCVYSIISHSLGTVVAFDYLFDLFNRNKLFIEDDKYKELPIDKLQNKFRNFFTLGSPIGLFMLRKDNLWNEEKPFKTLINPIAGDHRRWLNIYDIDDFVAYPLAELFYKNPKNTRTRIVDKKVNTGWTAIDSHVKYWHDNEVAQLIADILSNN
jgi:hypothetical protein